MSHVCSPVCAAGTVVLCAERLRELEYNERIAPLRGTPDPGTVVLARGVVNALSEDGKRALVTWGEARGTVPLNCLHAELWSARDLEAVQRRSDELQALFAPQPGSATNEFETIENLKRVVSLLVQRCGDQVSFTQADLKRADQLELRWNNNGHRIELCTLKDT